MHVLMIGLDATLITEPEGSSRQRHLAYAERAGQITIVTYTPPGLGGPLALSPRLTVIPTNSRSRALFPLDAYRLAARVARQTPVDLITTQDPFSTGLVGLWLRRKLRVPLLVQNHSYYFGNAAWRAEHPLRNRLFEVLGRYVVRRADFYRAVNRQERDNALALGLPPERATILPLGTASPRFAIPPSAKVVQARRTALGLSAEHKVILWVGYAAKVKRLPVLLEVFRRVAAQEPDARLLLVGSMAYADPDLPTLAADLGIGDRVIFAGPVGYDDLPPYYALASVYAHTSAYEGIGRVLMEAGAAGLPLVGMDCVAVNEIIEHGVNGYLVPDMNLDGMAARIVELLRNPAQARALGETARRLALERYPADRYLESWVSLWEQAIRLGRRYP